MTLQPAVAEYVQNLLHETTQLREMIAIVLKHNGGKIVVTKDIFEGVAKESEIVLRRLDDNTVEITLLEGKDEIEKVLGKPSRIIVPR